VYYDCILYVFFVLCAAFGVIKGYKRCYHAHTQRNSMRTPKLHYLVLCMMWPTAGKLRLCGDIARAKFVPISNSRWGGGRFRRHSARTRYATNAVNVGRNCSRRRRTRRKAPRIMTNRCVKQFQRQRRLRRRRRQRKEIIGARELVE